MSEELKEIEGLLQAELEREKAANQRRLKSGGVFAVIVALYLLWISHAIALLLDPAGLAEATTGLAITAVPEAGKEIRTLVVDGAPDLVSLGSDQLIALIPVYRETLQSEIDPVLDQVASVLADAAMESMAKRAGDPGATYLDDAALTAAADEAVSTIDATLNQALDTPDDEGRTPREQIDGSLSQLKKIDTELQRIAQKGGNPAERELLLAWLNVVTQQNKARDAALISDYKEGKAP